MSDSMYNYSTVPYVSVSVLPRFSHVTLCETKLVCETVYTLKHALKHRDR